MKHTAPVTRKGWLKLEETDRPTCTLCGLYKCKRNGMSKLGFHKWKNICSLCSRMKHEKAHAYKVHKEHCCSICGFVPVISKQLDIDHIDGNHSNNTPENLQTLCANCHRLKTHESMNWRRFNSRYNKQVGPP